MQQAVKELEAKRPAYATVRQTQSLAVQHMTDTLGLSPASREHLSAEGVFEVQSPDGSAAASVRALTGPGARWVSASGLASADKAFGGSIITAFCDSSTDAPHYLLEQTLFGNEVLLVLALWPRRDWMVDSDYLQRYYASTPPGCERNYNDVYNASLAQAGWRRYQSPEIVVKPMLSTAMAYSFEPSEENLMTARKYVLEVAQLWAGFLAQARSQGGGSLEGDEQLRRYDLRYVESVKEDPGNLMAARMFGQEPTDKLVATMHGWQEA